jgi:hypothetical protein
LNDRIESYSDIHVNISLIIDFYDKLKENNNYINQLQTLIQSLIDKPLSFSNFNKKFFIFLIFHLNFSSQVDVLYWKTLLLYIKNDQTLDN